MSAAPLDLFERVQGAADFIRERVGAAPQLGLILGSGLGGFGERLSDAAVIPYRDIPGFPATGVVGHAGRLVVGEVAGVRVVTMQGRVHGYEGYAPWQVGFPARVLCSLGIEALIVTNAAGGIGEGLVPGDLMRITDHLDLSGMNPLVGPNDERLGPRFPDMTRAYEPALAERLIASAAAADVELKSGVYTSVRGPSFETPAEIRMIRALGGDAVGMSTVPEVVIAAHMGVPLAGISCITNAAATAGGPPLSHEEVGQMAGQMEARFTALLEAFLPRALQEV